MFCQHCGAQLADHTRFCQRCGSPVQQGDAQSVHQQDSFQQMQPKKKGGAAKGLLAAIVAVAVLTAAASGVLVYALLSNGTTEPTPAAVSIPVAATEVQETQSEAPATEAPAIQTEAVPDAASEFVSAEASSVLSDQGGHSYGAANVLTDDAACWCEGVSGYGEGEWIKLNLPEKQRMNGLMLVNGYAGTSTQYDSNSKPTEIKLEFSDGTVLNVNLNVFGVRQRKNYQNIMFSSPIDTEYVKITIVSVSKAQYEDTCLTYVTPY